LRGRKPHSKASSPSEIRNGPSGEQSTTKRDQTLQRRRGTARAADSAKGGACCEGADDLFRVLLYGVGKVKPSQSTTVQYDATTSSSSSSSRHETISISKYPPSCVGGTDASTHWALSASASAASTRLDSTRLHYACTKVRRSAQKQASTSQLAEPPRPSNCLEPF
jgi:hypothetical protein